MPPYGCSTKNRLVGLILLHLQIIFNAVSTECLFVKSFGPLSDAVVVRRAVHRRTWIFSPSSSSSSVRLTTSRKCNIAPSTKGTTEHDNSDDVTSFRQAARDDYRDKNQTTPPMVASFSSNMLPELFHSQVLPEREELWIPQTDTVSFHPLCLCTSSGYYVNLLRVKGAGVLSRHRHPGPVHGYVLRGSWKYQEHDWVAVEGSYIFEPPGEVHTLFVPEDSGVEEMITLFHVTGSLLYCDESGMVIGAEDVFTKLERARNHYIQLGLGADYVNRFVR